MRHTTTVLLTAALASAHLLMTSCNGGAPETGQQARPDEHMFPVEVARPKLQEVEHTLDAVGSFQAEENVSISAEVAGTVKTIHVDEGAPVARGDVLLEIDDEKARLEVARTEALLREARARLQNAHTTLKRKTTLFQDKVIGEHDYDDARTQVALNTAMVDELQARLETARTSLRDTLVRAPIDGIVSSRLVSPGEYVKVGADLYTMVDTDPLKLVFSLPEKHAGEIAPGQRVSLTTRAHAGKAFTGTIYYISPTVDQNTRTIEVKARVPNKKRLLKPGFYSSVTVFLGRRTSLVLPESAVVVREGTILVMAVQDGRIVYKQVATGMRFNGSVEILHGVSPEDNIVVSGRSEITEGTPVRIAGRDGSGA